jgi:lysophospholipase L1-like esterase
MSRLAVCLALVVVGCSRREPPLPTPKEAASVTTLSGALAAPPIETAPEPPAPRTLRGKKVLHVGDSMVGGTGGLTKALEAKLKDEGATLVRHTKVSESLTSFDKGPTLRDLLRTHDPDIVVITLGANDALVPHPEVFARMIQNIVRRVGDRECWWVGPPMWTADTGIVRVLRENMGACHFFDSSPLALDRASDGIHPTDKGGAVWADAFWEAFAKP